LKSRRIFQGVLVAIFVFTLICPGNLKAKKEGAQLLITKRDGQVIEGELIRVDKNSILLMKVPDTKVEIGISEIEEIVIKGKPGSGKEDRKGKSPSGIKKIMKELKSTPTGKADGEKGYEINTDILEANKVITKEFVAEKSDVGALKVRRAEIKKAQIKEIKANKISTNALNVIGTDLSFSKLRVKKLLVGENTMYFGGSLTDPGNHIYTDNSPILIQSQLGKNYNTIINGSNWGKVGIGTTIPEKKLHLKGGVCLDCMSLPGVPVSETGRAIMRFQEEVRSANGSVLNNIYWDLFASSRFSFRTFANDAPPETIMTLFPGKKVGIGTINPKGQVHINGPNGMIIERHEPPNSFHNTRSKIFIDNSQGLDGLSFLMSGNNGDTWNKTLFLSESGNVGFGTGAPDYKLHLYGSNDQVIKMESLIESTGEFSVLKIGAISSNDVEEAQIQYRGKFRFVNPPPEDGNYEIRMIIDTDGKVGIGAPNPQSKLHVANGDIHITEDGNTLKFTASNGWAPTGSPPSVEIGSSNGVITFYYGGNYNKLVCKSLWAKEEIYVQPINPWPDFVFDKSYKLRSLDEVEAYIQENNHLQDVPTAKEVKENGLSLGKMDTILLRKIEELTLYMIELKKENEVLKKRLMALEQTKPVE
jgi:hypothetical protein